MGILGVAVVDDTQTFPNPAALYFYNTEHTFLFDVSTSELLDLAGPYIPALEFRGSFTSERMAVDLDVSYTTDKSQGMGLVDIFQTTKINFMLSYGFKSFSAGFGISGGSVRQRLNAPMKGVVDYINQFYLSQFERKIDSEFLQARGGFMFKGQNLNIGLLLDDVFSKVGNKTTADLKSILSKASLGFYYSRDEYSKRGAMNNLVYSVSAELENVFEGNTRRLNIGGELDLRLVRNFAISLRMGFSGLLAQIRVQDWVVGLGIDMPRLRLSVNMSFPYAHKPTLGISCLTQI